MVEFVHLTVARRAEQAGPAIERGQPAQAAHQLRVGLVQGLALLVGDAHDARVHELLQLAARAVQQANVPCRNIRAQRLHHRAPQIPRVAAQPVRQWLASNPQCQRVDPL